MISEVLMKTWVRHFASGAVGAMTVLSLGSGSS